MGKYIANTNCVISISPFQAADPKITCSKGFKVGGAECYAGTMTLIYTGIVDTAGNTCATLTITINGSSQKTKSKGMAVILENDNGKGEGAFVNSTSGATVTETVTATITSAGQKKVKSE